MNNNRIKTIVLLVSLSLNGLAIAQSYQHGISGGTLVLQSGDDISGGSISENQLIGINSTTSGDGIKIEGDGGITLDLVSSYNAGSTTGIKLFNAATNHLGQGSAITISSNQSTPATGMDVRQSELHAEQLQLKVTSSDSAHGISGWHSSVINLGKNSHIDVIAGKEASRGIYLFSNDGNSLMGGDMQISSTAQQGKAVGIEGDALYNTPITLTGDNRINVHAKNGNAYGLYFLAFENNHFTADKLHIISQGKFASGIFFSGKDNHIQLGAGSQIDVTADQSGSGSVISLTSGSGITLNQAILNGNNINNVIALQDANTYAELGNSTRVNFSSATNSEAFRVSGDNARLTANKLRLSMSSDNKAIHIMNIQQNSLIDLGLDSVLMSDADTGAWVWGSLKASNLMMISRNIGIETRAGGKSYIGSGSYIETTMGGNGGLVAYVGSNYQGKNAVIDFIGSKSERNYLLSRGRYGVSAQYRGAIINLEQSDIILKQKIAGLRGGLWTLWGGVINGKDIDIDTSESGAPGIIAEVGGIVNLSGEVDIDTGLNKIALTTKNGRGAPSDQAGIINANGKLSILGDIEAVDGGRINLTMQPDSVWRGRSVVDKEGQAQFNLDMQDSLWLMTRSASVSQLKMNNSTIRFNSTTSDDDPLHTKQVSVLAETQLAESHDVFYIGQLQGKGIFEISTNIAEKKSDFIKVTGEAQGNFTINVLNRGDAEIGEQQSFAIADIATGDALFILANKVEVGGYLFDLKKQHQASFQERSATERCQWLLYNSGQASSSASTAINAFSGNYLLGYAETQTLMQRLGELRSENKANGDFWIRHYSGKYKSAGNNFLDGYKMNYSGLQLGVHKNLSLRDGNLFTGGLLGFGKGNQRNQDGNGDVDAKTVGIYASYMIDNDWYIDNLLKYSWMRNRFSVIDSAGSSVRGERMATNRLAFSTEIGKRFYLNQSRQWFVEPQLQWNIARQGAGQFNVSNGLTVRAEGFTSSQFRGGVLFGYQQNDSVVPLNLYTKFSQVKEFDGEISGQLNDQSYHNSFADIWRVYGVGFNATFAQRHAVYADIERADGGRFEQPFRLNVGYRFSW